MEDISGKVRARLGPKQSFARDCADTALDRLPFNLRLVLKMSENRLNFLAVERDPM
jgi:hypothetical protein